MRSELVPKYRMYICQQQQLHNVLYWQVCTWSKVDRAKATTIRGFGVKKQKNAQPQWRHLLPGPTTKGKTTRMPQPPPFLPYIRKSCATEWELSPLTYQHTHTHTDTHTHKGRTSHSSLREWCNYSMGTWHGYMQSTSRDINPMKWMLIKLCER